jgi:hypothetical protein
MAKANKALIEARVTELLRLRLDGAEFWAVREYVREKEREDGSLWQLDEGEKSLSDSQLCRYLARVDQRIADSCHASRKKLLRRHLARRRSLYGKAVAQGDIRAALACLRDEAELEGLYGDEVTRQLEGLRRRVEKLQREQADGNHGGNASPHPATGPHGGPPGGGAAAGGGWPGGSLLFGPALDEKAVRASRPPSASAPATGATSNVRRMIRALRR